VVALLAERPPVAPTKVMASRPKSILGWELVGIPFVVVLGSALHFGFEWSGNWPPMALFAAVNESIWEHLKLAFWPGLLWAAIEQRQLHLEPSAFWAAKGLALLVAPVAIVLIFTTYTAILGENILYLDIGTFVVAVALGQIVSAWALIAGPARQGYRRLGHMLLCGQLVAYSVLTFFPLPFDYFMDARSGILGIPSRME